ncbi:MAG: transposase [Lentisphaerales bacterium]|nr:transposase [Lentisphaerales bacterium]
MLELATVFGHFWSDYQKSHRVSQHIIHCVNDILCCQTSYFGGDLMHCDKCGYEHFSYHSCKNRFCPKCYRKQQEKWLENRQDELVNCLYYHLVLTVPQQLHNICKIQPKLVYGILMKEASASIQLLCKDNKYPGADVGIMEVLHTWTRSLKFHPHVHCLIPAGGLGKDANWRQSRESFLIPVKALSDIFRAKVKCALKKHDLLKYVPLKAWKVRWVSFTKPSVQGARKVLEYLARYVFKAPISNSNILKIDKQKAHVTFKYCDHKKGWKKATLSAQQFIDRLVLHILPKGWQKVRYYGFWNSTQKKKLKRIIHLLGALHLKDPKNEEKQLICPVCLRGEMCFLKTVLSQKWRAPP